MGRMSPEEESLIGRAQLKSTGTSVHDLAGIFADYRACCDLMSGGHSLTPEESTYYALRRDKLSLVLMAFANGEDLKAAKRRNFGLKGELLDEEGCKIHNPKRSNAWDA